MPSSSWPAIGRSWSDANQPGSGTDIELCVAGSATSSSGRSHSAAWPLQRVIAGAGVVDAAAGDERGERGPDEERGEDAHRDPRRAGAARPGPRRSAGGLDTTRRSASRPL